MTEFEWLACTDPQAMLDYLRPRGIPGATSVNVSVEQFQAMQHVSDRKLRLFACACRRLVPYLPWDGESAGWQEMEDHPEMDVPANGIGPHTIPAIEHARLFVEGHALDHHLPHSKLADLLRHIVGPAPFRPPWSRRCVRCEGKGAVGFVWPGPKEQIRYELRLRTCPECHGRGWLPLDPCQKCKWPGAEIRPGFDAAQAVIDWKKQKRNCRSCHGTGCAAPHLPAVVTRLAEALYHGENYAHALHDALLEAGQGELAEHFRSVPGPSVAEVLESREHAVSGGCCNRFADQMACDCLEEARRRERTWTHPKGCWAVDAILGKE